MGVTMMMHRSIGLNIWKGVVWGCTTCNEFSVVSLSEPGQDAGLRGDTGIIWEKQNRDQYEAW